MKNNPAHTGLFLILKVLCYLLGLEPARPAALGRRNTTNLAKSLRALITLSLTAMTPLEGLIPFFVVGIVHS